jgi:hypothetical protein
MMEENPALLKENLALFAAHIFISTTILATHTANISTDTIITSTIL